MQKIFTALFIISFIFLNSCQKNSNGTVTVVPIAPSNLTAIVASTSQLNLSWTDNSTNETGFKIERKTGISTYTVIATLAENITTFSDQGLTPNTTYTYRIYAYNSAGASLTYSNELTVTTMGAPLLTTTAVSLITASTALSGGVINSDGGSVITARGVTWSINPNPTISLSTKTIDGNGTGGFTSNMGLISNTLYYFRAYATNANGITGYGNEMSFTTLAAPAMQSVTICSQVWTTQNIDIATYRNGDPIPQITDLIQWSKLTTGAWCYYSNVSAFGTTYGKLYNWYAVNDSRGLAPQGWHIPSDLEWTTLFNCLGGISVAGGKMKEIGTTHWLSPNFGATNTSGLTALPGGYRFGNGTFTSNFMSGLFWSSKQNPDLSTWCCRLDYGTNAASWGTSDPWSGFSIRCVKD
jgi:uncharacterized protein (TIGR02145 family)